MCLSTKICLDLVDLEAGSKCYSNKMCKSGFCDEICIAEEKISKQRRRLQSISRTPSPPPSRTPTPPSRTPTPPSRTPTTTTRTTTYIAPSRSSTIVISSSIYSSSTYSTQQYCARYNQVYYSRSFRCGGSVGGPIGGGVGGAIALIIVIAIIYYVWKKKQA